MKKYWKIAYCVVFFAVVLAPLALISWGQSGLAENRPLAPAPVLVKDGRLNLSAPIETEEFFADRFAGRTRMIDAYSRLIGGVFGVSANEKVIVGRDGWLFFGETAGDYTGSAALDDAEMSELIQSLLDMKRTAEQRGQVFIIAVAPNKNTLYGEYMPVGYKKSDAPTNLDHLLAVEELECIDFRSALLDTGHTVYYKTDSHWNGIGSRMAAREIMLEIEAKTGMKADFDWADGIIDTGLVTGDLGQMLYPVTAPSEEDYIYEDTRQNYTTVGRFRSLDDMHITTESDGLPLKVAMYRDSFANSLIPYFSNAYSSVYYTRQTPPQLSSDAFMDADVIIFEIAERRLGELIRVRGTVSQARLRI